MAMSRISVTMSAPITLISVLAIALTVFLNIGKLDRTLSELEDSRLRLTVNALRDNLETGLDLGLPVNSLGNAQAAIDFEAARGTGIVANIYNPAEPNSVLNVRQLRAVAAQERFQLDEHPVPLDAKGQAMPAAPPHMVAQLAADGVQLLYIGPDSFLAAHRKVLTDAALARRLPTFSATEVALRDGKALFGLVSDENVGRLSAHKAAQILAGGRLPASIPIETLARFSYLGNMSVAAVRSC